MTAKLTWLNSEMEKLSKDGPYFLGKDYSIVDISFIPHFDRLVILLKHYRNYEVPKGNYTFIKIPSNWVQNLLAYWVDTMP